MHFLFFINEFSFLFSNEFALAGRSWGRRGASDSHKALQPGRYLADDSIKRGGRDPISFPLFSLINEAIEIR